MEPLLILGFLLDLDGNDFFCFEDLFVDVGMVESLVEGVLVDCDAAVIALPNETLRTSSE